LSRKDYNKLARAIYVGVEEDDTLTKADIAQLIANALKGTNPRFDSRRFYMAAVHGGK